MVTDTGERIDRSEEWVTPITTPQQIRYQCAGIIPEAIQFAKE
jgi:hypothetical protein